MNAVGTQYEQVYEKVLSSEKTDDRYFFTMRYCSINVQFTL